MGRDTSTAPDIPVVILCGGGGTRLREETEFIPKPMVTVGGKPLLWHLMQYGRLEEFDLVSRALNEYEIDTVMYLGAQTIGTIANRAPLSTFEANIRGTWHVLEACRLAPTVKTVVTASSDKAHGAHDRLPYDESTPPGGAHPCDLSKSCADLISLAYHRTYGLPVCQRGPMLVSYACESAVAGRPAEFTAGDHERDFLFVDDLVGWLVLAVDERVGNGAARGFHLHHLGTGRSVAVRKVLELIEQEVPTADFHVGALPARPHEPRVQVVPPYENEDPVLGRWRPTTTLEDGIHRTIAWWRTPSSATAEAAEAFA